MVLNEHLDKKFKEVRNQVHLQQFHIQQMLSVQVKFQWRSMQLEVFSLVLQLQGSQWLHRRPLCFWGILVSISRFLSQAPRVNCGTESLHTLTNWRFLKKLRSCRAVCKSLQETLCQFRQQRNQMMRMKSNDINLPTHLMQLGVNLACKGKDVLKDMRQIQVDFKIESFQVCHLILHTLASLVNQWMLIQQLQNWQHWFFMILIQALCIVFRFLQRVRGNTWWWKLWDSCSSWVTQTFAWDVTKSLQFWQCRTYFNVHGKEWDIVQWLRIPNSWIMQATLGLRKQWTMSKTWVQCCCMNFPSVWTMRFQLDIHCFHGPSYMRVGSETDMEFEQGWHPMSSYEGMPIEDVCASLQSQSCALLGIPINTRVTQNGDLAFSWQRALPMTCYWFNVKATWGWQGQWKQFSKIGLSTWSSIAVCSRFLGRLRVCLVIEWSLSPSLILVFQASYLELTMRQPQILMNLMRLMLQQALVQQSCKMVLEQSCKLFQLHL